MAGEKGDQFANYAIITVTESAANTLTFKKLETGISLNEKIGWVINRLEYYVANLSATQFNASGDIQYFGLSLGNSFTVPSIDRNEIIDYNAIERLDIGTAASGFMQQRPFVKDLSNLPGGGILVPPAPLFLFSMGSGLVAASVTTVRMHYTMKVLKVEDYWELVEARRVLSS